MAPATRTRGRVERDDLPDAAPRSDAYTGMLAVSLVATLIALVFLWLDYSDYSGKPLPQIRSITASAGAPAPADGAPRD